MMMTTTTTINRAKTMGTPLQYIYTGVLYCVINNSVSKATVPTRVKSNLYPKSSSYWRAGHNIIRDNDKSHVCTYKSCSGILPRRKYVFNRLALCGARRVRSCSPRREEFPRGLRPVRLSGIVGILVKPTEHLFALYWSAVESTFSKRTKTNTVRTTRLWGMEYWIRNMES